MTSYKQINTGLGNIFLPVWHQAVTCYQWDNKEQILVTFLSLECDFLQYEVILFYRATGLAHHLNLYSAILTHCPLGDLKEILNK